MHSIITDNSDTLQVGILGTGKIGTDLLIKVIRSKHLNCNMFAGRNLNSPGMQKAQELGITVSDQGIQAFSDNIHRCDLVFDATAAHHHNEHAQVFFKKNIKAIDLTPAKVGPYCIPALNQELVLNEKNINMVTCGGQTTVPIAAAVSRKCASVQSLKVDTVVSHDSIGQATIDNIDDYYSTTAHALSHFSGIPDVDVNLTVAPEGVRQIMTTHLEFELGLYEPSAIVASLRQCEQEMQSYVPGYQIIAEPQFKDHTLHLGVQVRGLGDWVPEHAGNLDIINCSALHLAENVARERKRRTKRSLGEMLASFAGFNNKAVGA